MAIRAQASAPPTAASLAGVRLAAPPAGARRRDRCELGVRHRHRHLLTRFPERRGGGVDDRARELDLDLRTRELVLEPLVGADLVAELLAIARIRHSDLEHP